MPNPRKGSTFDSFLEEEGLLDEAEAIAVKRVIAFALKQEMKKQKMTKSKMAAKMHTSRAALERLLDPVNTSVTLRTLIKAAHIVDRKLKISIGSER